MPTRILELNREIHTIQQKPQSHSCSKKTSSLKPNAGFGFLLMCVRSPLGSFRVVVDVERWDGVV